MGVVDALQYGLLTNSEQIVQVIDSLHTLADDLLAERGSKDRLALRERLQGEKVTLQDSYDYRPDFTRLQERSDTELEYQENQGRAKLIIGAKQLLITRPVVQVMLEAAKTQSFLVVGGAGTGKTGCLLTLANQLRNSGERVWYWAADSLPYHSPEEIQTYLGLQYSWRGLFAEAASGTGAILIVDGLDGLRDSRAMQAYQKLFSLALKRGIKVIASIRYFDLQYSEIIEGIFPSMPENISWEFRNKYLKKVNHFIIANLDDNELNEVISSFPEIESILKEIPQLRELIQNLFSLDILCKLIAEGESAVQLSNISTQAELFDRYWKKRVELNEHSKEITEALQLLIEKMVNQQTLQVVPEQKWTTELEEYLFSTELIRHPHPLPGRLPKTRHIEFNHHLLFDYLAERLFVRSRYDNLAHELNRADTWGLFLRPSLVLFHRYTWNKARLDFWDLLIDLERKSVSVIQKVPGYLIIAEEAICRKDLQPLLEGINRNDQESPHWKQIIQGAIFSAKYSSLPKLFKSTLGDWWLEFACDLIKTSDQQLVLVSQEILFAASSALESLSEQAKLLLNHAATSLLQFYWSQNILPSSSIRLPIECLCRTITSNLETTSSIIQRIISYAELQRAGYIQIYEVANCVKDIWQADPDLGVNVYDSIFSYLESSDLITPIVPSNIMALNNSRKESYEIAYNILAEKFPSFLSEFPREGTQALIRIIKHFLNQRNIDYLRHRHLRRLQHSKDEIETILEEIEERPPEIQLIVWNNSECRLQSDRSHIWDSEGSVPSYQTKMLLAWSSYLMEIAKDSQAEDKWQAIADVIINENELAAIWRRILLAGSRYPEFYAQRLWTILLNPQIFFVEETQKVAENCLKAFTNYLSQEIIQQIESTILEIKNSFIDNENSRDYLKNVQAQLLCCIPEEKRSLAGKKFLAECTPELLQPLPEKYKLEFSHVEPLSVELLSEENNELDTQTSENSIESYYGNACGEKNLDEILINEIKEKLKGFIKLSRELPLPEKSEHFDRFPYICQSSHILAVKGLICLAIKTNSLTDEWKNLLHKFANDPDPEVRCSLGEELWSFLDKWPEFVWETLERWASELPDHTGTAGVLSGTLHSSWFSQLRNRDAARAEQFFKSLMTAARLCNLAEQLRSNCGAWLAALWFFEGEIWAGEVLNSAVDSLRDNSDELYGAICTAVHDLLPRSAKEPSSSEQHQRAMDFLLHLLSTTNQVLQAYTVELSTLPSSDISQEQPVWVKKVAQFFPYVATEFHFCAKERAEEWKAIQADDRDAQMRVWWVTAESILDAILVIPHPGVVFDLIQGLGYFIDLDIERSLHWIRKATLASVPAGLANESLAANCTIEILYRILADQKTYLLQGNELRSDFVQILEAYLKVGWSNALRLAVKIESIFR